MKRLILIPLLGLLMCTGCTDNYGAALKAHNDISTGIASSMNTVDNFRKDGVVTPQEESNILDYLEAANKANEVFLSCSVTVHGSNTAGGYTACGEAFITTLSSPQEQALLHVANPAGLTAVTTIAQGIITGVNSVIVAFGGM
jgi:hypothetical protein